MERLRFDIQPFANDPGAWGASFLNLADILVPTLDAVGARSVVEVGAYAGDLTGFLLKWANGSARVSAVDPSPQPELEQLAEQHKELELVRATSLEALRRIPLPDVVILDGDHNYYTVSEELRIIDGRAAGGDLPLVILHDVTWPHGRRDDYFSPEAIPEEYRQPIAAETGLYPGVSGVYPGGLPYHWPAAHEGGPRNGVLTAVEDFVEGRDDLSLAVVPAFFGFGAIWRRDAPWADAVAEILDPWDRNPLLERLERNRVLHLASSQVQLKKATRGEQRVVRQEALLRKMLNSRIFSLAELLLRVRQRGEPVFSKDELRRVLAD